MAPHLVNPKEGKAQHKKKGKKGLKHWIRTPSWRGRKKSCRRKGARKDKGNKWLAYWKRSEVRHKDAKSKPTRRCGPEKGGKKIEGPPAA